MTAARRLNLAAMTVSGAPGTGAIALSAASGNYQTFASAATNAGVALAIGDIIWCKAIDGAAWQIWPANVTNASGPVLAAPDSTVRGFSSSTGSVLSLTSAAIISAEQPQEDIAQVPDVPGIRLTLVSGQAVMTADQTAKTAIYATPINGGIVALYNGASWIAYAIAELTLTLNTSNHLTPFVYDIFIWNNAGVVSIGAIVWSYAATVTMTIATPAVVTWTGHGLSEGDPVAFTNSGGALPTGITAGTVYYVSRSPAANTFNVSTSIANAAAGTFVNTSGSQSGTHTGTNRTRQRGTGAGTPELQNVDGMPTNKNSVTLTNGAGGGVSGIAANTALLAGCFACTANGQTGMAYFPSPVTGGTNNFLALYNAWNRVLTTGMCLDLTGSWTDSTVAYHANNASVLNRITVLDGLAQSPISAVFNQSISGNAEGQVIGIGLNATNVAPKAASAAWSLTTVSVRDGWAPTLGLSFAQEIVIGRGSGTGSTPTLFGSQPYGDLNSLSVTLAM